VVVVAGLVVGAGGAQAATPSAATISWGSAQEVPGTAALNTGGGAKVSQVACAAQRDCTAAGYYQRNDGGGGTSGPARGFVTDAANGTWAPAQDLSPGQEVADVGPVSCAPAGPCTELVGVGTSGSLFARTETAGTGAWSALQPVTLSPAPGSYQVSPGYLSCTSAGNCAAGGYYMDVAGTEAFVADEKDGIWDTGHEVPGTDFLAAANQAYVRAVSCASDGNCAAGGSYRDTALHDHAYVVDETAGAWGTAVELPGIAALEAGDGGGSAVSSVSCGAPGDCAAVGTYWTTPGAFRAFVADETNGSWQRAEEVPGSAPAGIYDLAQLLSVSCPAAGECAAGGYYNDADGALLPLLADEHAGTWVKAQVLPGTTGTTEAHALSVSCASPGNCAAGGYFYTDHYTGRIHDQQAMVITETGGTWGAITELPGTDALNAGGEAHVNSVSCAPDASCAAGGYYTDAANHLQAFTASTGEPTTTAITVSTPAVTFGNEQAATVSVSVGAQGVPVTGSVTVTVTSAWGPVCVITLVNGAGTCTLPATGLPIGTAALTASYPGTDILAASTSPPAALQVMSVPSATTLSLGEEVTAPQVTYGNEQGQRATVTVIPAYGPPATGQVAVKSGTTTLCTITLANGAGTCTLPPAGLPVGTAKLTASYPGTDVIAASTSPAAELQVLPASSAATLSLSAGRVTYGNEQGQRATVTVTPAYGPPATGQVALKSGTATLCTITLATGHGTCTLSAAQLPAGTWHLSAVYPGSANVEPSASPSVPLTVAKEGTATTLTLSAPRVRYGAERAEHLAVAVTAPYGKLPGVRVSVKSGRTVLCTPVLASGKGTCTLAARQLRPGTYTLTVTYPGNANFAGSASARKTLTITR
jgi:hypothetical protein